MKIILALLCFLYVSTTFTCPTCVGLPRLDQRPFFERPQLLNLMQAPKVSQPQHNNSTSQKKTMYSQLIPLIPSKKSYHRMCCRQRC